MAVAVDEQGVKTVEIVKVESIDAPIDIVFQATLDQLGPDAQMPDGTSLSMVLEAWPGGRWYRDLGKGAGHFWAHVQVIKPPTLLEFCGPMFMSFPASNHLQYRLTADGQRTTLKLTHKSMGMIPPEFGGQMETGWNFWVKRIISAAEGKK